MKTLPKLSEYVTKLETSSYSMGECFWLTKELKNLITQPLNISHFVPAIEKDGKWIILEEPQYNGLDEQYYGYEMDVYQTALENVVFKGFEFKGSGYFCSTDRLVQQYEVNKFKLFNNIGDNSSVTIYLDTIESIIPYNLELNNHIIEKYKL